MASFIDVIKQTGSEFSEDNCMVSGAAIAYYTIFSLPPLLALIFMIATQFVSREKVDEVMKKQVGLPTMTQSGQPANGSEGAQAGARSGQQAGEPAQNGKESQTGQQQQQQEGLDAVANRAGETGGHAWWAKVLGIVVLVFSATGVLAQLQFALNKSWGVEPDPEQGGLTSFIIKRVLSLAMIVVFGLLLLVSLVLTTLIDEIIQWISGDGAGGAIQVLSVVADNLLSWGVATVLFAATFKILPDAKTAWKDVWVGAAVTGLLFVIGTMLIGWYLQYSDAGSDWGSAAASMVGVLVWVYYSSLIVLLGAEFTQVWAQRQGSGIHPSRGAVRVVEEKRHIRDASEQPA